MSASVVLPKCIVDELEGRGLDVEDFMIRLPSKELNLDPEIAVETRLELAEKYLAEGKELVDRDHVEASERLYRVAGECMKALVIHHYLEDILGGVEEMGRWIVTDLEKAVKEISKMVSEDFLVSWGEADHLHVWGFTRQSWIGDLLK